MEKRLIWSERVQEWRASGVSMNEFCRDKEYTASSLSYWGRRLASESPAPKSVRLARVVRSRAEASPAATVIQDSTPVPEPQALVIESGMLRVHVPAALDRARLESVLIAVVRSAKAGAG